MCLKRKAAPGMSVLFSHGLITWCCFLFMFPLVVCGVPPLSTHQQHRSSVLGSPRVSAQVLGCSRPAAEFLWAAKCRRGHPSFCCGALWEIKHLTQTQGRLWHGKAGAWSPAEVPTPLPWARSSPRASGAQWGTWAALGHAWLLKQLWVALSFCS